MNHRLAIVSDVHGNLAALEAVIADLAAASPDLVLHGGDLAYSGANPAAVVDRIRELGWPGVQGNTDEMLWVPARRAELQARYPERASFFDVMFGELAPYAVEQLGDERLAWLRAQPLSQARPGVGLVHAQPNDLWEAPSPESADQEFERAYGELGAEAVVVYGHIHRSHIRRLPSGRVVANSGSVSLSFDGDTRASYLLLTGGVPEIRRVAYDVEREAGELQRRKVPRAGWIAAVLRAGRFVAL